MRYQNRQMRDVVFYGHAPKGEVGIEVEVEGGPWPQEAVPNWAVHQDGSLRNGIEYVIAEPIQRDKVIDAMDTLSDAFKKAGSKLSFSYRTSIHVHINIQSMTVRQWVAFVAAFTILEEMLVDVVGPKRAGNKFCLRMKDAEQPLNFVRRALREDNLPQYLGGDLKYASMNLLASMGHGTLEFRAMSGNLDGKFINDWVQVLLAIKDYALKVENPASIIGDLSNLGPLFWAESVLPAGNSITQRVLASDEIRDSLYEGVRLAQDICFAIPWEDDPMPAVGPAPAQGPDEAFFDMPAPRARPRFADIQVGAAPMGLAEARAILNRQVPLDGWLHAPAPIFPDDDFED